MKDCEGLLSEFSRIVLESRVSFLDLRLAACGIATQLLLSFLAVAALSRFVLLNHHQCYATDLSDVGVGDVCCTVVDVPASTASLESIVRTRDLSYFLYPL